MSEQLAYYHYCIVQADAKLMNKEYSKAKKHLQNAITALDGLQERE